MESVPLEHENVTEWVLYLLGTESGRFSNAEKDPMTSKELNEEPYEVKISCTVLRKGMNPIPTVENKPFNREILKLQRLGSIKLLSIGNKL